MPRSLAVLLSVQLAGAPAAAAVRALPAARPLVLPVPVSPVDVSYYMKVLPEGPSSWSGLEYLSDRAANSGIYSHRAAAALLLAALVEPDAVRAAPALAALPPERARMLRSAAAALRRSAAADPEAARRLARFARVARSLERAAPEHLRDWETFIKSHDFWGVPAFQAHRYVRAQADGSAVFFDGAAARARAERLFPRLEQPEAPHVRLPSPAALRRATLEATGFDLDFADYSHSPDQSNADYLAYLSVGALPMLDLHDLKTHWPRLFKLRPGRLVETARTVERLLPSLPPAIVPRVQDDAAWHLHHWIAGVSGPGEARRLLASRLGMELRGPDGARALEALPEKGLFAKLLREESRGGLRSASDEPAPRAERGPPPVLKLSAAAAGFFAGGGVLIPAGLLVGSLLLGKAGLALRRLWRDPARLRAASAGLAARAERGTPPWLRAAAVLAALGGGVGLAILGFMSNRLDLFAAALTAWFSSIFLIEDDPLRGPLRAASRLFAWRAERLAAAPASQGWLERWRARRRAQAERRAAEAFARAREEVRSSVGSMEGRFLPGDPLEAHWEAREAEEAALRAARWARYRAAHARRGGPVERGVFRGLVDAVLSLEDAPRPALAMAEPHRLELLAAVPAVLARKPWLVSEPGAVEAVLAAFRAFDAGFSGGAWDGVSRRFRPAAEGLRAVLLRMPAVFTPPAREELRRLLERAGALEDPVGRNARIPLAVLQRSLGASQVEALPPVSPLPEEEPRRGPRDPILGGFPIHR